MNYSVPPKKMLIINILDILKKYSDSNHRLSQAEIARLLEENYMMKAERKAIRRNLFNLLDAGCNLEYTEIRRGDSDEGNICTDWYLVREFDDTELSLLVDSLLFSKHIPYSQCKELIGKLEGLSSIYFHSRTGHISKLPDEIPVNKQVFFTIGILDDAIGDGKQVSFRYCEYRMDKQLHYKTSPTGTIKEYCVNPYQMVAANGKHYLIGNIDKYHDAIHFRLDRITDIQLLDSKVKPMKEVAGLEDGLDLPRHMAEHIYMFPGKGVRVVFKAKKYIVNELFDWFGGGMTFSDETEDEVTVSVTVNEQAMRCWAEQYLPHITVLSPESLVESIKKDLKEAVKKYNIKQED